MSTTNDRQTDDTTGYATDISVRVNKCQSVTKLHKLIFTFVPTRSDVTMPIRITKYLISGVVTVVRRVPI